MKNNVRKWLATALAVALSFSLVPLNGLTVSADSMPTDTNLVTNGDFEFVKSGEAVPAHWHGGTYSADAAYESGLGLHLSGKSNAYQTVAVDKGCSYLLTFRAKVNAGQYFTVRVNGSSAYLAEKCAQTDWAQYTFLVNVTDSVETAQLSFATTADTDVFVDDVSLVLSGKTNASALMHNGNFETGNASGWSLGQGEIVAYEDGYALKATATSKYAAVATQTIPVEADADYTLTLSSMVMGASSAQARVHVYAGTGGSTDLVPIYYWNVSDAWSEHTLSFHTGANTTIRIVIQQDGKGGAVYYDNFVLSKAGDLPGDEETNHIDNGGFEDGTVSGWSSQSSSARPSVQTAYAHTGDYSMLVPHRNYTFTAYRDVAVEPNTTYVVSFCYINTDPSNGKTISFGVYTTDATQTNGNTPLAPVVRLDNPFTEFTSVAYTFNSGADTTVRLAFGGTSSSSTLSFLYVDDIEMAEQLTAFPTESIKGTYYTNSKAYGTIAEQTVSVEEGKVYRISFSARAMTNGFRLVINDNANGPFWAEDARGWIDTTQIVRAESDLLSLKLRNLGNGTLTTHMYITDFVVEEIPDTPQNLFRFNGKSAMEMNPALAGETAGHGGLAFLFTVDMSGAQVATGNSSFDQSAGLLYQTGSATARPFTNSYLSTPYDYKVIEVGTVVSLVHSSDDSLTLENVTTDSKTIRIKGEKRWEVGEDFYKFAIRVRNIPENHFGTTVYVRPYAIVETANGTRQVTLYGDVQYGSYLDTINPEVSR